MTTRKITFVLGAGASVELGFPLGRGLQEEIRTHCGGEWKGGSPSYAQGWDDASQPVARAMSQLKHSTDEIRSALERIRDGILEAPSIDTFLHNNKHSQAVVDCGKLAIARAIVAAEFNSPVFGDDAAKQYLIRKGASHWEENLNQAAALSGTFLSVIWDEICQPHTRDDVSKIFENIAFVNFNYDRSLETMLVYKLKTSFGLSAQAAHEIVDTLEVIRPYGAPHGNMPLSAAAPKFGDLYAADLCECAGRIRTFAEAAHDSVPERIKNLMGESKAVVFLGFGFHRQNVDLFDRNDDVLGHAPTVYFSWYGGSDENADHVVRTLKKRIGRVARGTSTTSAEYRYHIGSSADTLRRFQFPIFRSR